MLSPSRLLEDAVTATGLSDFGDPSFREGLDRLCDSLNGEAALSPLGAAMAEGLIRGALANRLRVEGWIAAHPEVEAERITSPIVIVGMSRSGTTALSHLLGRDPNLRSLLAWESNDSVPPPQTASVCPVT